MISDRIGEIIRKRREDLGIGQTELAELSGTSQGYISELENGKVKNPTIDSLFNIAAALKVKTSKLISEIEGVDSIKLYGKDEKPIDFEDLSPEDLEIAISIVKQVKALKYGKK